MKYIIFLGLSILIFTQIQLNAQSDTAISAHDDYDNGIIFGRTSTFIDSTSKHVRVEHRTSHRYPSWNYIHRNTRILQENETIIIQTLTDSNIVISSTESRTIIVSELIDFDLNDSFKESNVNRWVIGEDKNMPSRIICYNITLQKHGKHKEFYSNGVVKVSGAFFKGLKSGVWIFYDSSGNEEKKEFY